MGLARRRRRGAAGALYARLLRYATLATAFLAWSEPELSRQIVHEALLRVRDAVIAELPRTGSGPRSEGGALRGTASVIDGDTIDLHGTRIRLWGIDAPESGQRCTSAEGGDWRCGKEAGFALADRIGRAPVACEVKDTDRYGRKVALCRDAKGADLNGWMVREGWAVSYRAYSRAYVGAEDEARSARRGIWTGRFQMPWDWRKARLQKGGSGS